MPEAPTWRETGDEGEVVFLTPPNGVDDRPALQGAIDALPAIGGTIALARGTYVISAPLSFLDRSGNPKNGVELVGAGAYASIISNPAGDVLNLAAAGKTQSGFVLRHLKLSAAGGHVVNVLGGLSQGRFYDFALSQNSTGFRIWNQPATGTLINVVMRDGELTVPAAATVESFYVQDAGGTCNANRFADLRCNGADNFPFFYFEEATAAQYLYNNKWDHCTFEVCRGGCVHLYSGHGCVVEDCVSWDMATRGASIGDGIRLSKTTGASSVNNAIRRFMRSNGALGGGLYDINLVAGNSGRNTIEGGDSATLTTFSINLGSTRGNRVIVNQAVTLSNVEASSEIHRLGNSSTVLTQLQLGDIIWARGAGSPEGVLTAPIGSHYSRSDGGAGTSLYVKESGAGNTGWVGK